jgi:transcriptional regulator with XRE-family HTH domain
MDMTLSQALQKVLADTYGDDKQAMADGAGVSVKTVYRWLNGDRPPRGRALIRMAHDIESESPAVALSCCTELELWQILKQI